MKNRALLVVVQVVLGVANTWAQLTPGVLEVNSSINGNTYVFTLGGCGDECGCKDGCCNETLLQEKHVEYNQECAAGAEAEDRIGYGADFQPSYANICDLQPSWTTIFHKPFQFDGRIDKVQFLICENCGDAQAGLSTLNSTSNTLVRLALFTRSGLEGTCTFALLGYIELKRADFPEWDSFLTNAPLRDISKPAVTMMFEHYFTDENLVEMGAGDYAIEGLYFGFQWASAGCVCYQKWNNAWINDKTMCMGEAFGELSDTINQFQYYTIEPTAKRGGRRYNMGLFYSKPRNCTA